MTDSGDLDPTGTLYPDGRTSRVDRSLFCERCGYNLRTLPYVGRCPECGNAYNARGLHMTGILLPQAVRFPSSQLIALLLAAGVTLYLLYWFRQTRRSMYLALAGGMGLLTLALLRPLYRDLARYLHCRHLIGQIRTRGDS